MFKICTIIIIGLENTFSGDYFNGVIILSAMIFTVYCVFCTHTIEMKPFIHVSERRYFAVHFRTYKVYGAECLDAVNVTSAFSAGEPRCHGDPSWLAAFAAKLPEHAHQAGRKDADSHQAGRQ